MIRYVRGLLVALLVLSVAVPGAAVAQADTRNGEVAVETPAGTDSQVSQQRVNGTIQYTTDVTPLELHPQDFAMEDVVDYGVATPGGSIEQQTEFGQYAFDANASGTYRVYWIVSEQVVTNTTTNETAQRQVRYETLIRIQGDPGVQTLSTGQYQQLQTNAQKWRDLNSSTLQPLMDYDSLYAPEPDNTQALIDKMDAAYRTTHNIIAQLGGNISAVIIILATTLGGLFLFAIVGLYHLLSVRKLQRKLNVFRTRENREGELAERQKRIDESERQATMENQDLQDVPGMSEQEAEVLRENLGIVSIRDMMEVLARDGPLSDVAITLDRFHAMGAAGYGARVTPTDGDGHDVELVAPPEVPDFDEEETLATTPSQIDGETWIGLAGMDGDMDELVLREMDQWDSDLWRSFDMASADFDAGDVPSNLDSLDVEAIQDELGIDQHRFDDPAALGQALYDLAEHIRMHPSTGADGTRNPTRETMERLLKVSNVLADQYQSPVHEDRRQHIQRALQEFDIGERADRTISDVSSGAGAD